MLLTPTHFMILWAFILTLISYPTYLKIKISNKTEKQRPFLHYSLAKMLVLQGRIRHIPEEQLFVVSSEQKKYMVTLFPQETCTCKAKRHCHHIRAVKLSIGDDVQKQKNIKLSTRRQRGFRAGRKKGPANITIVEAADDSLTLSRKDETGNTVSTILVPTITTDGNLKHRFYPLPNI